MTGNCWWCDKLADLFPLKLKDGEKMVCDECRDGFRVTIDLGKEIARRKEG